jgi:competence protein ComEC
MTHPRRWRSGLLRARLPRLVLAAWLGLGLTGCRSTPAQGPKPAGKLTDGPLAARLHLDFLDVGQGDSTLVVSPTGKTLLIDGGPAEAGKAVGVSLRSRKIDTLDMILLTHRHADHLGGLRAVVDQFGTRLFMDAPYPHDIPAYERLLDSLEKQHVPIRQAQHGRTIDLGGGARLTLLGPPEPLITGSRSDVNANSVVSRLDCGKVGVLFAADAEATTEKRLLDSGVNLHAAILKVAHHGGRYSSTPKFLQAVQPLIAVISVGAGNEYHHPDTQTLGRLERMGVRIFRTDLDGPIAIESDCERIQVLARGRREIVEVP